MNLTPPKKFRRFFAILKKEFRQIRRDPLSLGLLLFIPALLLVLYGYALSFDVKHIAVGVLDLDRTQESRRFLDGVFQNAYFDRVRNLTRIDEVDALLARRTVWAVLVVPRGFAGDLKRGEEIPVQFLVDGSDANSASITVNYLEALTQRATLEYRGREAMARGLPASMPGVVPQTRIWFNPDYNAAIFLVPGLIGMLLMISAVIATSLSIVREKERETMEQIMVSPVKPLELILGKTVPYVLICLATMVLILLLAHLLFGVSVQGSYWVLGITTLLFLVAALGMGIFISSVTNSQQVAFQIAILSTLLPAIILSGFIFPIKNMPLPVQLITYVVIPRYFVEALRGVIVRGAGFLDIWPQLLALVGLAVLFNGIAVLKTRKAV